MLLLQDMQQKSEKGPEKFLKDMHPFNKFIWDYRLEILSGLLMLAGLIISFFYVHTGGALVGLSVGICFFNEMYGYFSCLREFYLERGAFKTLMIIGIVVYFLISIPVFIVAVFVGFGIVFLIQQAFRKAK